MHDAQAYPNGTAWNCGRCGAVYPEDYEPTDCQQCGWPALTRTMLTFKLGEPPASPLPTQESEE